LFIWTFPGNFIWIIFLGTKVSGLLRLHCTHVFCWI
jgi:hypothetical protein